MKFMEKSDIFAISDCGYSNFRGLLLTAENYYFNNLGKFVYSISIWCNSTHKNKITTKKVHC